MHATWMPAGIPTHSITLSCAICVCASASPPILPGVQRCRPRGPAEYEGQVVEVHVTASLRALHTVTTTVHGTV